MAGKKLGRPAPAAAALFESNNNKRQDVIQPRKRQNQPLKAVDANCTRRTLPRLSSVPSSGLGAPAQPRDTAAAQDVQSAKAPMEATSTGVMSVKATGVRSQAKQKACAAIPEQRICTRNAVSRRKVPQARETSTSDGVLCRPGADAVADPTASRSRTAADLAVDVVDRVTPERAGMSASDTAILEDSSVQATGRKRQSLRSHASEGRRKRQAPKSPKTAEMSSGPPSPEGAAIYRTVCQLEKELEEKVKPFREAGKQRRVRTLRGELKNKSHFKEVQKLLRQKCSPCKKTETTANDVPWVESPVDTDDEPTLASPRPAAEQAVHYGPDPAPTVSVDASKWSMCDPTTRDDKHVSACDTDQAQQKDEVEGLQQQVHRLREENAGLRSRYADLEVKLLEQQELSRQDSHKASCAHERALKAVNEDVDRFGEQLAGLIGEFKSLQDSITKLKP